MVNLSIALLMHVTFSFGLTRDCMTCRHLSVWPPSQAQTSWRLTHLSSHPGKKEAMRIKHSKASHAHCFLFCTVTQLVTFFDRREAYNPGQKSWDTFAKTPQIRAFPLHPLCNVDVKGPTHPESLQALSALLGVGGGRAVTKTV